MIVTDHFHFHIQRRLVLFQIRSQRNLFRGALPTNTIPFRHSTTELQLYRAAFNPFVVVTFSDTLFFAVQSGSLQFLVGCSYQLFKTYQKRLVCFNQFLVVPLCTSTYTFGFYATYNSVCTLFNLLFIIILNKHQFVTRYVFYISVCMICAYLESSIVAVFYFVLNSEGSLNNLKLTAFRTLAIGLTLKVSFSSSMHIIRKLTMPAESLFEGLSEK